MTLVPVSSRNVKAAERISNPASRDRRPVARYQWQQHYYYSAGSHFLSSGGWSGQKVPDQENTTVCFSSMPPAAITAPFVVISTTSRDANSSVAFLWEWMSSGEVSKERGWEGALKSHFQGGSNLPLFFSCLLGSKVNNITCVKKIV